MRMRDFMVSQAGEFSFLWKSQLYTGVLLVLLGVTILMFPAILIALVATGLFLAGASLIGGAWGLRRLCRHSRHVADIDTFEW